MLDITQFKAFKNYYLYLISLIKESTANITIALRLTQAYLADQAVISRAEQKTLQ